MDANKLGQIVWHDLFTANAQTAQTFYDQVADWQFVVEHATDFAWGGGERDFILALLDDQAGAGFVELAECEHYGWVPYVEVPDVDAAAAKAVELKGTVLKAPFEVPGVGRNCLLRDPNEALIGICLSRHKFPVPTKQFGLEIYLAEMGAFPVEFYSDLFDWNIEQDDPSDREGASIMRGGAKMGLQVDPGSDQTAQWVPSIRVGHLPEAIRQVVATNGSLTDQTNIMASEDQRRLVCDPNGALSVLVAN